MVIYGFRVGTDSEWEFAGRALMVLFTIQLKEELWHSVGCTAT